MNLFQTLVVWWRRHQQQLSKLKYENEALTERLESVGRQLVTVSDSRVQLERSVDEQKLGVHRLQQELDSARRTHAKEVITRLIYAGTECTITAED